MSKKLAAKTLKGGSVRGAQSRASGSIKTASTSRTKSGKNLVGRNSGTGKFVSAKTGRIVKSSPAEPKLGRERIRSAVTSYVNRNT